MIDLQLFKKIMAEARHSKDLLDSVSPNQYKSKEVLIKHVEDLQLVDQNSHIVIFGGWYGSILIPAFKYVDKITLIDKDKDVIGIAKNRLFDHYKNVEFISDDVFSSFRDQFKTANLFINTSCEHMKPMNQWGPAPEYKNPWWDRVRPAYFAFQSNNMYDIPTHINCVSSIEEFKYQLPEKSEVMVEDKIRDERGTRFLLIGKL
jgi:hypothetical protein|tara:strand:+ start:216 stop:827 length:612 start_codon:yes stop_codon:yes gene_type:complete